MKFYQFYLQNDHVVTSDNLQGGCGWNRPPYFYRENSVPSDKINHDGVVFPLSRLHIKERKHTVQHRNMLLINTCFQVYATGLKILLSRFSYVRKVTEKFK